MPLRGEEADTVGLRHDLIFREGCSDSSRPCCATSASSVDGNERAVLGDHDQLLDHVCTRDREGIPLWHLVVLVPIPDATESGREVVGVAPERVAGDTSRVHRVLARMKRVPPVHGRRLHPLV